ncbi:MAG: galactokinase [Chloroflexi bacterium]|nr:MAG: galactokinase [Chloroflexota bacterium]
MTQILESTLFGLLDPIYGPGAPAQTARYQTALEAFARRYGPGPVHLFRAPGRVNLIGEHTDYNHGFVLPAALDKDILLLARPRPGHRVRLSNIEPLFEDAEFELGESIPPAPRGHWSNYLRGAAQMVAAQAATPPPGLDILVAGTAPAGVPRGAGLSSSSALVVAMAVALAHLAGWQPERASLAHRCADAEWYVGTRGGIMDHFAALLSRRDHALFLDCRADAQGSYHTRHIPFPATHRLVVVDSGLHHDNVRGEYNRRVAACRAGVGLLRRSLPDITHLRDVQNIPWADLAGQLPEVATPADLARQGIDLGEIPGLDAQEPLRVAACCRHVWTENARVLQTLDALAANDIAQAGRLLHEAHASARDDYAISTPELDFLVSTAETVDGVAGARLTGAGWGGCVVVLVAQEAVGTLQTQLAAAYAAHTGRTPAIFLCQAGPGAGPVASLSV